MKCVCNGTLRTVTKSASPKNLNELLGPLSTKTVFNVTHQIRLAVHMRLCKFNDVNLSFSLFL